MRIATYMLVLSVVPYFGFGQNKITGKVVDQLGFPIYRASAEISTTDIITYTDYDGSFLLKSEKDFHWKVNIKSKGYEPESFFVLSGGNTGYIVLEYDDDIKKLLDGNSGLRQNFYWDAWKKAILVPKSEKLLASAINSSN
ncbi:carboxypeptidase-like regulatory domain-containing protein [Flagellimonas sp. HMM57]|uniref:carboxypeptidase-like regulatory domain-containing protein n=1 Tax=unclassified Flagellimonas TaxID=2644544 RepID=UPI0013D047A0|nr:MULTISPECIES: carboxypeptidase-like regulatory domain-containing protein [unclassified Flagellimonas]UII75028.1 carboxypeptidase-like regulatory domain-containing protein [Flagellimonas sp. HMM57]